MSNFKPFNEAYVSRRVDPLWKGENGFAFHEVDSALNECVSDLSDEERDRLVYALKRILQDFVHGIKRGGKHGRNEIAMRCAGFLLQLSPDYFEGSPSIKKLAWFLRVKRSTLARYAAQARRSYGIRNRCAVHAWNYKAESA